MGTESFKSVFAPLLAPAGVPGKSNATGPITTIEIMAGTHADGSLDLVYWSDDGNQGLTAFASLEALCTEHQIPIAVAIDAIAREFVAHVGERC